MSSLTTMQWWSECEASMCKDKGGPKGDPFLTIPKVAEELDISERSVWRLVEDGELSAHKFGASTRIRRSDLDAYIKRSRREPPRDPDRGDADDGGDDPDGIDHPDSQVRYSARPASADRAELFSVWPSDRRKCCCRSAALVVV